MRLKNLVGKEFGMLTVIRRKGYNSSRHITWECLCACGNTTVATGNNLNSGHSKSCGCLKRKCHNRRDLTGETFGRLRVLRLHSRDNHVSTWECVCHCGNHTVLTLGKLISGHTKSCGCLSSEASRRNAYKYLAGKKKEAPNKSLPKRTSKDGYVRVHDRDHPRSCGGFVLEHIKVMEAAIGRPIPKTEYVHHINGVRNDNRPENLELWVKAHPPGQRVQDAMSHYVESILTHYFKDSLAHISREYLEALTQLINHEIERRK